MTPHGNFVLQNHSVSPRDSKSVAEKLLSAGQPLYGLHGANQAITNSASGPGKLSVRALRKTGLRIKEVAGATPILYNDLQIPVRIKGSVKCEIEDTTAPSAQHLDMPGSSSDSEVNPNSSSPLNRGLKTSTSESSLSMIPLIARCPTDKPCPLTMAPRRKTEQRSLKNQTRYTDS